MAITIVVAALALGSAAAGWWYARESPPHQGPIIIIAVDGLKGRDLSPAGVASTTSPALDGLAADGVTFTRAYAHAPLTLPSYTTLLTGRLPFDAQTTAEVLRKHILEGPPAITPEAGDQPIPEALQEVVLRCLEKDPAARPITADALRIQLLQACDRRRQNPPPEAKGTGLPGDRAPEAPTAVAPTAVSSASSGDEIANAAAAPTWRRGGDGRTTVPNPVVAHDDLGYDKTPRDPMVATLARMDAARSAAGSDSEPHPARPIAPTAIPTAQIAQLGLLSPDVGRDSPPLADALDPLAVDVADPRARPGSAGVRHVPPGAAQRAGFRWLLVGVAAVVVVMVALDVMQLRS